MVIEYGRPQHLIKNIVNQTIMTIKIFLGIHLNPSNLSEIENNNITFTIHFRVGTKNKTDNSEYSGNLSIFAQF